MPTRIAVIGAGIMGAEHARIITEEIPGAILQVACDTNEVRAKKMADACGAQDIATNPETVISRADVDAVIVATPDFTHAQLAVACIAAGKKVLLEKPMSQSSSGCIRVMKAEMAAGEKNIQLGFMRRYDQSYSEMKRALTDGTFGQAVMMHNFHRNVETPAAGFSADMAITNSAPHEFDIARFILDADYTAISAFSSKSTAGKVGAVFMVLEANTGQLVNIEINNNATYGYDVRGELVGEKGAISLATPVYSRLDIGLHSQTRYAEDWRSRYAEAYIRQNRDFINFVNTGQFSAVGSDSWDGYAAAVVAEAGVKALNEDRKIQVEMITKPELYA